MQNLNEAITDLRDTIVNEGFVEGLVEEIAREIASKYNLI